MITDLFSTLTEIAGSVGALFTSIFQAVGSFFYTPGAADAPGQFTIFGIFLLVGVVFGLVFWGVRLIRSLISGLRG